MIYPKYPFAPKMKVDMECNAMSVTAKLQR